MIFEMNKYEIELLQQASGALLTKHLPDDWYQLPDDEQMMFLDQHKCEHLEDVDPETMMSMIDDVAHSMTQLLDVLHSGLVSMAISADLPSDMNELCLDQVLTEGRLVASCWDQMLNDCRVSG